MAKKNSSVFEIFLQAIGLYFTNIDRFVWYMLFPVLGQLAGLLLTSYIIYSYTQYSSFILSSIPLLRTPLYMNIAIGIVLLPGVLIWAKAFFDYIVAYSAVNSMTENMLKSERVYDFPAHTLMVTRRTFQYLCLYALYFGLILLSATVIFAGFAWVLMIYYAFIFQIFLFEPDLSPSECFKKSSGYVQTNLKQTFCLILMLGTLTYIIFPQIILVFLDTVKFVDTIKNFFMKFITVPSLDGINMVLSAAGQTQIMPEQVALFITKAIIILVVIQFLLPLRVICMCLWYKNFYNDAGAMKKIDDRILDRAGASKRTKRKK